MNLFVSKILVETFAIQVGCIYVIKCQIHSVHNQCIHFEKTFKKYFGATFAVAFFDLRYVE